jgi:hypothetical protein
MEIELQPAGRLRDESGTSLIAPATVINYGLSEDWEAVFEGQGQTLLSGAGVEFNVRVRSHAPTLSA